MITLNLPSHPDDDVRGELIGAETRATQRRRRYVDFALQYTEFMGVSESAITCLFSELQQRWVSHAHLLTPYRHRPVEGWLLLQPYNQLLCDTYNYSQL